MKSRSLCLVLALLLPAPFTLLANNLVITNVAFVNVSAGEADIQFDISWDNSWRTSWDDNGNTVTVTNWDAVWVFAKFRQSGGLWKHVMIEETGHAACGGLVLEPAINNGTNVGAMTYRDAEGSGSITCQQVRLHWNYAASGLAGTNEVDVAVLGIEMVYIPEGPFYLGSGGDEFNHFYQYPNTNQPFLVTNSEAIVLGSTNGALFVYGAVVPGTIPAEYPNGYDAFYCMKYEMTQGQYADFLNFLDLAVASPYYPNAYGLARHTIIYTNGAFQADAPDRSCNYINLSRLLGYLDWAGLRPMTDLEFTKICRGPRNPLINEYVWGTTAYVALTNFNGVDGSGTETALPASANVHLVNFPVNGPVRVGIFATSGTDRERAGSSYFGVTDMAGNMYEVVVSATRPEGRTFLDEFGDGNEYNALPASWPPNPGARAYFPRGGTVQDAYYIYCAELSDRSNAEANNVFQNPGNAAVRGIRTLP